MTDDSTWVPDWHLQWDDAGAPGAGSLCRCPIGEDHPSAGPWPELLEVLDLAPETRQDVES